MAMGKKAPNQHLFYVFMPVSKWSTCVSFRCAPSAMVEVHFQPIHALVSVSKAGLQTERDIYQPSTEPGAVGFLAQMERL